MLPAPKAVARCRMNPAFATGRICTHGAAAIVGCAISEGLGNWQVNRIPASISMGRCPMSA